MSIQVSIKKDFGSFVLDPRACSRALATREDDEEHRPFSAIGGRLSGGESPIANFKHSPEPRALRR